jgi:hypothetical protein
VVAASDDSPPTPRDASRQDSRQDSGQWRSGSTIPEGYSPPEPPAELPLVPEPEDSVAVLGALAQSTAESDAPAEVCCDLSHSQQV